MRIDDLLDKIPAFLALIGTLLIVGSFVWIGLQIAERNRFMAECAEENKHFECVAMWRGYKR